MATASMDAQLAQVVGAGLRPDAQHDARDGELLDELGESEQLLLEVRTKRVGQRNHERVETLVDPVGILRC